MNILAFDSSSKALSVALVADGVLLGEVNLNVKKNHSTTLMTAVDFLMAQTQMAPEDLERIAVAAGPGSYTGLRMAVTVGKTLAFSLNKEIVGVSSLFAIASRVKTTGKLVVPVMDARRGNAYAGIYENGVSVENDQHCVFADFLKKVTDRAVSAADVIFTGETANFVADILAAGFTAEQIMMDSLENLPSAYEMAKLAEQLAPETVHGFVPNYLKKVEAEEKWLETHEEAENAAEGYVQRV
jgi:tRNA threonylcarbamoyl adenosine modification protein YeaZ